MLLFIYLYTSLLGLCSFLIRLFYIPFPSIKIKQDAIHALLFIILAFSSTVTHSQEHTLQPSLVSAEIKNLSDVELLEQAQSLRGKDQKASIELANEALQRAKINNNLSVSAQAHAFLSNVIEESKDPEKAFSHYLQALFIFKKLNDKNGQINTSIDYSKLLLAKKEFKKSDKIIDDMILVAIEHQNQRQIARTLIVKGNSFYIQKNYQKAIEKYYQSIQYLSKKDKNVQQTLARTYTNIAESFKRLKNREQTANFYKKALDLYTTLRNKRAMARTLNTLAEAERYLGNLVIALDYSIRGLEIHTQIDDPEGRAKALNGAGIIYRHIGRYEKSLKHVYEAHLYYKKINDIKGIAKTSNQMGLIYTRLKQFDQAKYFYQLTISLPEEKVELKTIAAALRELAVIYLDSGDYESAKTMSFKAIKIYANENEKTKESTTARIIANIYRAQNDESNAIDYYRKSLSLAIETGSSLYKIKSLIPLASILIGKDADEAIKLLKDALKLSIETNDAPNQLYTYRLLRKAEKRQGNIMSSLAYAEKEISMTSIIQNERENSELVLQKANLHSHKMEIELEYLREKVHFDKLELTKKNNEIEIAKQARKITELELMKNKYSNIALVLLLAICILMVVFIYRRFIASKKRNKELDYLAARDPLTNCYNRRILFDHINQGFSNSKKLERYCIIMVDIDNFKNVNDTFGHSAGDSVLCGVANIFQSSVRQNDIVARFGGEEFCIILHKVSQNQALSIAEVMRQKIETSLFDNISVTCSFGVTSIEFNAKEAAELIEQADLALYRSKSLGKNQVTLWDQTFEKNVTTINL